MMFSVEFPGMKLKKIGEPKYMHLSDDHEVEGKPAMFFDDCKTLDELNEMVAMYSDEQITIDSGIEITVQSRKVFDVVINNESDLEPLFKVDFSLTSWKSTNERAAQDYINTFPDTHFGFDMIALPEDDDCVRKTSNVMGTTWLEGDELKRKLALNAPTDFLPKKFGSPVYLVITVFRNMTLFSIAYKVNITLSSTITPPRAEANHELQIREFEGRKIPKYVWDYEVGLGRFASNLKNEIVTENKKCFSPIGLGDPVLLQIHPMNFTRAYSKKNVNIRVAIEPPVDLNFLEHFEEDRIQIVEASFDGSPSLPYIRSYDFGFLHFSVDWKHFSDPKGCFELALKFNESTEELFKKSGKVPKPIKLMITISYERKIIDESETMIYVYPKSLSSKEKQKLLEDFDHVEKKTPFVTVKPVKIFFFLNIIHEKLKTNTNYLPCILYDLDRESFYHQILEAINKFDSKSLLKPLKICDITELRLHDQILINQKEAKKGEDEEEEDEEDEKEGKKKDKKFVSPAFTLANKSVFDIKFKISRVKDKGLPGQLDNERLMHAIRNTDLGTKNVVDIHILTAANHSSIQDSLDDIDKFSHTFPSPNM